VGLPHNFSVNAFAWRNAIKKREWKRVWRNRFTDRVAKSLYRNDNIDFRAGAWRGLNNDEGLQ